MEPVYEVRRLLKRRGAVAVLDVPALVVHRGQFCGLVGPNGSGKTTLIEVLAGLEGPDEGEVRFCGERLPPAPAAARTLAGRVASVLQPAVLFRGSVLANVEYGLRASAWHSRPFGFAQGRPRLWMPRRERQARAREALGQVGLAEKASCDSRALSRGEAQRVALARALVLQTDVLLLDEPLTALDREHCGVVLGILRRLKEAGRTIIMAAHDADAVLSLADQLAVLDQGRLRQQELTNVLSGTVEVANGVAHFRSLRGLRLDVLATRAGPARVVVEPSAVLLSKAPLDSSARNSVPAIVREVRDESGAVVVTLDAGERLVARITAATEREMRLRPGDAVYATMKSAALRVL